MSATTVCQFEGQTLKEEAANSITHGFGVLLSIAATVVLTAGAALQGSGMKVVTFAVFGFSACLLYSVSTLYHAIQKTAVKRFFHALDHSAIFVLIAGTYTPISLIALQGGWGWSLFGVSWGLALVGAVLTLLFFERVRALSTIIYLLMGWLIAVAAPLVFERFSLLALIWLTAGGLCYTFGVFFYRAKRLRGHHAIWHVFVLAGSVCHFFLMTVI